MIDSVSQKKPTDPALDLYHNNNIADLTISNTGCGLFVSRICRADTCNKDHDLVSYYDNTPRSLDEVEFAQNDPNYTRNTCFVLMHGGITIYGWDHDRNTYTCDCERLP